MDGLKEVSEHDIRGVVLNIQECNLLSAWFLIAILVPARAGFSGPGSTT